MKHKTYRTMIPTARVKPCVLAFSLSWVLMNSISQGQSAQAVTPTMEEGGKNKKETPAPQPVDNNPSRFAGDDISPYTLSRSAAFSMSQRETDPFGLYQDTSAKPPEKTVADRPVQRRSAALPPTPLSDVIKLIRVTTTMPGEKKFLVGVRTFSEGERFSLQFQGKLMRMKVTEVLAKRITFMNLENGDTAAIETGILPSGMVAGKEITQPAGMVSSVDDLPLDLSTPNAETPID